MCNPGTQEGVTVTTGKFKGTWPANLTFIEAVRKRDGLLGVAVDPLTSHECGNRAAHGNSMVRCLLTRTAS